jgi:ABC-type lipoprotein release transport system permease subunit
MAPPEQRGGLRGSSNVEPSEGSTPPAKLRAQQAGRLRTRFDTFKVIALIATRNLLASRWKTLIVGGIIFFGAFLVVLGTSLLDSVDLAMSRSIIGSVAGHTQVYSAKSKAELEVMGSFDFEGADLAPIDDFARLRDTLLKIPNVKSVVPMGISGAIVTSGNTIDLALAELRELYRKRARLQGEAATAADQAIADKKAHVRQMVTVLEGDLANIARLQDERAVPPEDVAAVKRAASPEFWQEFEREPLQGLEFLENRIAPQGTDADMLFLRYVGTDPSAFARSFDRMKIVDGTAIPPGQRGFMFSKFTYEEQVKLKTARRLDKMKIAMENRKATIATDPVLQQFVRENGNQVRELALQLDAGKTELFRRRLQQELGHAAGKANPHDEVTALLTEFFKMDDSNFARRYQFFYRELAPSLDLYRVRVGDTLTIKAFTRSGYVQSINLRVYGTFNFEGLEQSPQAGELNLMDMVSFRELYGFLTDDRRQEIAALKAGAAAKEVTRENVEAELFANREPEVVPGARQVTAEATPGIDPDAALAGLAGRLRRDELAKRVYDPKQLEQGVVLNAAVILHDPEQLTETMAAIEKAGTPDNPLKAISWQKASGIIGQFVTLARIVLNTAVLIIFVVALVIINNALVMATLERVQEIGTLRAVGAQRRFIVGMLVIESIVIGAIFGLLGAAVGALVVWGLGRVGIPAANDVFTFFFSGPRLHPQLGAASLITALAIVLVVSALSSFYPAWLAMRVTPRQAMQTEE